jgi:hypothetical protein
VFKSYDPRWLADADYGQLTEWLGRRFFRQPEIALDGVRDIDAWRRRLRTDRVFVSYSSGTSGSLSFVPRDPIAQHALRTNGAYSFHRRLPPGVTGIADLACLVLGSRGSGMGIHGAATGLARAAHRSHFLFNEEVVAADVLRGRRGGRGVSSENIDDAFETAFRFLHAEAADRRPLLLFGTPFELERACAWALDSGKRIVVPAGSLVVTGGGWKGERSVSRAEMLDDVQRVFAVRPADVIDVYSTAESNAVLLTCVEGHYHVPPLVQPVIVDDALQRVEGDDVVGVLGLLDPFAVSYPGFLITGDQVRLTRRPCPCGLTGWSIVGPIERAPSSDSKGCAGVLAKVTG